MLGQERFSWFPSRSTESRCLQDHVFSIDSPANPKQQVLNLVQVVLRSAVYVVHLYFGERTWSKLLSDRLFILSSQPEKTVRPPSRFEFERHSISPVDRFFQTSDPHCFPILHRTFDPRPLASPASHRDQLGQAKRPQVLFASLLLTALSLFIRPAPSTSSFARRVQSSLSSRFRLSKASQDSLSKVTSFLPRQTFPLLLLLRLPLLIIALRQQIFLRPYPPYTTANGQLRILSSEKSLTGQIVVAENLLDGYRFLRCDHSILGGRWTRQVMAGEETGTEMGDSIFPIIALQEVAILAHRSDANDTVARALALASGLEVSLEAVEGAVEEEKPPERALIVGLGVGVSATALTRRGLYVDVVEVDPAVYQAAVTHFELRLSESSTIDLINTARFIEQLSGSGVRWSYVIQDCSTVGSASRESLTVEYWEDVAGLVDHDGIVAVRLVGLLGSRGTRAVVATLLSVFGQCRLFGEGSPKQQGSGELVNMAVFCTMAHSPLLTFRRPTSFDVQRSPLRFVPSTSRTCRTWRMVDHTYTARFFRTRFGRTRWCTRKI